MEVPVIRERGEIVVRDECRTPDVEELIDDALREVSLEVNNFSKLESFPRHEGGPVIIRHL
jgi:hypothetical protein